MMALWSSVFVSTLPFTMRGVPGVGGGMIGEVCEGVGGGGFGVPGFIDVGVGVGVLVGSLVEVLSMLL